MRSLWHWLVVGSVVAAIGCSNSKSDAGNDETGGTTGKSGGSQGRRGGSGGSNGSGGAQGSGGTNGSGGTQATGGTKGSGGSQGSGGVQGAGGTAGSGGTQGSGGAAGSAGQGMTGGGGQGTGGKGTGGSEPTTGCNDISTATGSLSGEKGDETIEVPASNNEKSYQLHTNWWFKHEGQVVDYNGLSFTIRDPKNVSVGATEGNPTGYPTLFVGTYAGKQTKGSNLPKQVSQLTTVPTVLSTNALSFDTSNYNAAYDVWFTANSSTIPDGQWEPGEGGAYLMVWLFDPAKRQPRGGNCGMSCSANHPGHSVQGVAGSWDVWIDPARPADKSRLCISYVSTQPKDSLEFDLNNFIQDAVKNNYGITQSMYLSIVFAGFEIWGGGNGLQAKKFCAKVN